MDLHEELDQLQQRKQEVKSLIVAIEARDAGGNLTQAQQDELSNNNLSLDQLKEEKQSLRENIYRVGTEMHEYISDSDIPESEDQDMFPDEEDDNNNNNNDNNNNNNNNNNP
ncbi:MAG: hypothetical protein EOP34_03685 [Rickettsiales bacterium]|nr:MAG: hypothetical protein EOP34_03685 [Rickettsiales bacterium]